MRSAKPEGTVLFHQKCAAWTGMVTPCRQIIGLGGAEGGPPDLTQHAHQQLREDAP